MFWEQWLFPASGGNEFFLMYLLWVKIDQQEVTVGLLTWGKLLKPSNYSCTYTLRCLFSLGTEKEPSL